MGVINLGILIRKLSHVFLRKDEAATELSTLGFVKNTDYAGADTGTAGVLKYSTALGCVVSSTGVLQGYPRTADSYNASSNNLMIAKGTLENVKTSLTASALGAIADSAGTAATGTVWTGLTLTKTATGYEISFSTVTPPTP